MNGTGYKAPGARQVNTTNTALIPGKSGEPCIPAASVGWTKGHGAADRRSSHAMTADWPSKAGMRRSLRNRRWRGP